FNLAINGQEVCIINGLSAKIIICTISDIHGYRNSFPFNGIPKGSEKLWKCRPMKNEIVFCDLLVQQAVIFCFHPFQISYRVSGFGIESSPAITNDRVCRLSFNRRYGGARTDPLAKSRRLEHIFFYTMSV